MENEKKEEEKEITSEYGANEFEPIPDEETPESSTESKPEEAVEPPEAGTDTVEPVEVTEEAETAETVETTDAVSPLEAYIAELEKVVGTRRGETETPEAYALRLEVTKLKRERRDERKEIFGEQTETKESPLEETEEDPLFEDDAEELKRFDRFAKKRGLVHKDELQSTTWNDKAQDILEDFQVQHKEYNDDALWDKFKGEFQSGKYNIHPQNPKLLTEIFNEIHNKLVPRKTINPTAAAAGAEKIKAAAHGGTTVPDTQRKPIDPDLKSALKGFSDKELEEMSQ